MAEDFSSVKCYPDKWRFPEMGIAAKIIQSLDHDLVLKAMILETHLKKPHLVD